MPMMQNVKNTIAQVVKEMIFPHYCCSCGRIGSILCKGCEYDIVCDRENICLVCKQLTIAKCLCSRCPASYTRAFVVSARNGAVAQLIDQFKFYRARDAALPLADLLVATIGQLPPETVIVPVPTIAPHIRQRGYDHTVLLARRIAQANGVCYTPLLRRRRNSRQRGSSRSQRQIQAQSAFVAKGKCVPDVPYLIIDDIATTGSTLEYAARALYGAGATEVWVAVVAVQPLD